MRRPHYQPHQQQQQQQQQRPAGAEPEWLRRSYTRTIPRDLRTVAQLRRSFEDLRSQWRALCEVYARDGASPMCHTATSTPTAAALPAGTLRHMDQIVSQLKAVKQELLAQLSKLSTAVAPTTAAASSCTPAAAGEDTAPAWATDLVECSRRSGSTTHHPRTDSAAVVPYLEAVWLARRVWVWSICVACATMDLELLSGSVSVAAELFFGNCAASPRTATQADVDGECGAGWVKRSSYSVDGAFTEAQLYAVAASATSQTEGEVAQPEVAARSRSSPNLQEEECELQAFFGCCSSTGHAHRDPNTAATDSASQAALRDAFWVQAVALCYSSTVRDDTSAAQLHGSFNELHRVLSEPRGAESLTCGEAAVAAVPAQRTQTLCAASGFVRLLAERLVDEDYGAITQLFEHAGYTRPSGPIGSADATATSSEKLLCDLCPGGGVLMRFLVRLLAEHVVRRRWTELGMGHAFRPVEPAASTTSPGVGTAAAHRNRLVGALADSAAASHAQTRHTREGDACAVRLCDALQRTALRDMGGDWPLPPSILRSSFA